MVAEWQRITAFVVLVGLFMPFVCVIMNAFALQFTD